MMPVEAPAPLSNAEISLGGRLIVPTLNSEAFFADIYHPEMTRVTPIFGGMTVDLMPEPFLRPWNSPKPMVETLRIPLATAADFPEGETGLRAYQETRPGDPLEDHLKKVIAGAEAIITAVKGKKPQLLVIGHGWGWGPYPEDILAEQLANSGITVERDFYPQLNQRGQVHVARGIFIGPRARLAREAFKNRRPSTSTTLFQAATSFFS